MLVVPGAKPVLHYTVERHWEGNARDISRVPAGDYALEWHGSEKYPISWALVGEGVSHFHEIGVARFGCLIHAANWPYQLQGCIAPGTRHLTMAARGREAELAVAASRRTMDRIHKAIGTGKGYGIRINDPI